MTTTSNCTSREFKTLRASTQREEKEKEMHTETQINIKSFIIRENNGEWQTWWHKLLGGGSIKVRLRYVGGLPGLHETLLQKNN